MNKVAIITGGSKGIGFGVAKRLSGSGVKVVLVARTESKLQNAVKSLEGEGHSYLTADLSKAGEMDRVVKEVLENHGRVDFLINSAGRFLEKPLLETSQEEFENVFALNLFSLVDGCRACIEPMNKDGGVMINISSQAGSKVYPNETAYGSSKAAVNHFTRILQKELPENIKAVAVAPGSVDTPLLRRALGPQKDFLEKEVFKTFTLEEYYGKILKPEDVADKIVDILQNPQNYVNAVEEIKSFEF